MTCCTALYCTVLKCTVLYCTVLHCTELYCDMLYCTVLYCDMLYCTVLYCDMLYCTVLYCTVLYCTVLYCTVLYCNALYCTVLYCMDKIREELFEYILSKLIVSGSCDVLPVQSTHSTISTIVLIPMREKRYTKTLITMPLSHTQLDIRLSDQLKLVAVEDFSAESLLH